MLPDSPARGFSFGQVQQALICLGENEDHKHLDILKNELARPLYGKRLFAEWEHLVDWWNRKEDHRSKMYTTTGKEAKRHRRAYEAYRRMSSSRMYELHDRVLDAAGLLARYLPEPMF
jgi:hypothetical protein